MNLPRQFQALLTAGQFLTRVPLPGGMNQPNPDRTLLRSAVIYFPLVGGLIGTFTGIVIWSALQVWPPIIAVALGLIAEALFTGAFHEDAVADCCDAFGGGWSRDDVLRILKDSRVGSFGALGLMLAVLLRGGCILTLPAPELIATVAASATLGRWAILVMMAAVPPVPARDGLTKDVGEPIGSWELAVGFLLTLPGSLAFAVQAPIQAGVAIIILVSVLAVVWANYVRWRIGGLTGDCLGCGCYLGQCGVLLVAAASLTP